MRRNRSGPDRHHHDHPTEFDANLPLDPDVEVHLAEGDPHLVRTEIDILLVIFVGGFFGTLARYLVSLHWTQGSGSFPLTIFLINVSGSFAIGVILTSIIENLRPSRLLRPLTCVGFLGGWTTMSTLALQGDQLISSGHVGVALTYLVGSAAATSTAAAVGILIAHRLPHTDNSERGATP